ncbi:MAG: MerR family transcriptional regulator [Acidobacteriota bacterium]|nr:MerR family transcriptional regulator [Acidobacteriota bacterium]
MKKVVYSKDELIVKAKITEKTLSEWEKIKLLKPDGMTNGKIPFYKEHTFEKVLHIKKLLDIGYELGDINKIIRKVGMPQIEKTSRTQAKSNEFLTVGGLAERVGVSPRAIKHWETKGIIEPDMRSEGGFRLYSEIYIYLCNLIKDLQLFGYSLEEIKTISDLFRDFLEIRTNLSIYSKKENEAKFNEMLQGIQALFSKTRLLKEGMERWDDLLKKKKKEVMSLKNQNKKRSDLIGRKK